MSEMGHSRPTNASSGQYPLLRRVEMWRGGFIGLDPHREREARQWDQRGQGRRRMLASRLIGLFFSRYRVAGVIRSKQFYSKVYLSTLAQVQS